MTEQINKGSRLTVILVIIIIGGAFFSGQLYNRVKTLEKQLATTGKQVAGEQAPTVPAKVELKINDTDPSLGDKNAKVTVVIFSDFLCPYCAAYSGESKKMVEAMQQRDSTWQAAMPNIIKDYVNNGKVRMVWKDLPFHGEESVIAHAAAHCANDQGKFWEYHNLLFKQQDTGDEKAFSKDNLKKLANTLKLNTKDFNSCVDGSKYENQVKGAISYGQGLGIDGTPTTLINGKLFAGALPYESLRKAVEEELKK